MYFLPAALPLELNIQDNPPRVQCVPRGGEVELTCEYPPGNLRELYSVQWRFRENDNDDVIFGFGPNGVPLPSGNLLSIDEGTFALTVEIERLDQTGDQFHCDVNVRRNNIGSNVVRYIGAIVELNVQGELAQVHGLIPILPAPKGMSYWNETASANCKTRVANRK